MKFVVKYLVCVLLLILHSIHHARMLDVVILNGIGESRENRLFGTIELFFARGVCQQLPMIASAGLVRRYVERAYDAKIATSLTDATWEIYENKQKSLYLLLPTAYIQRIEKQFDTPGYQEQVVATQKQTKEYAAYTARDILFGFALSKLTPVKLSQLNKEHAFSYDQRHIDQDKRDEQAFVTDIQGVMLPGKGDVFGLWNILLIGHGSSVDQEEIRASKGALQKSDSNARIAHLTIQQYRNLLQFLAQKINTNMLFLITCHGGDLNLILPYTNILLNDKGDIVGGLMQPNFTIAVGATTSVPVGFKMGSSENNSYLCGTDFWRYWSDYESFFALLHEYGDEKAAQRILYNNLQIKKILAAMSRDEGMLKLTKIPHVRFPGTDIFRAVAVDDTISVLSEVAVHHHVYEKQPFVLKDQQAILLYPRIIPVELIIEKTMDAPCPIIMSMQPGIGLHCIKQITTTMNMDELFKKSFAQIIPLFPKYYYIEKLIVTESLSGRKKVYTDVFIAPAVGVSIFGKYSIVNIVFTQQGADKGKQKIYQLRMLDIITGFITIRDTPRVMFLENRGTTYIPDNPFLNAWYTYFKSLKASKEVSEDFDIDQLYPFLTLEEQKQLIAPAIVDKRLAPPLPPLPQKKSVQMPPPLPPLPQSAVPHNKRAKVKQVPAPQQNKDAAQEQAAIGTAKRVKVRKGRVS